MLVCSDEARKARYPFDIQHRAIIAHGNDSTSDFDKLKSQITDKLKALVKKNENIQHLSEAVVRTVEGLEQHEVFALATTAENIDPSSSSVSAHIIRNDMERSGFTRLATNLALKKLNESEYLRHIEVSPANWNEQPYSAYSVTERGWSWLESNKEKLVLRKEKTGEDIPF